MVACCAVCLVLWANLEKRPPRNAGQLPPANVSAQVHQPPPEDPGGQLSASNVRTTQVVPAGHFCLAPPPHTCYTVSHDRHRIYLLVFCELDELYAEATLAQGNTQVTVLGRARGVFSDSFGPQGSSELAWRNGTYSLYEFLLPDSIIATERANLSLTAYFHCVRDLYGQYPTVRETRAALNDSKPSASWPIQLEALTSALDLNAQSHRLELTLAAKDGLDGAEGAEKWPVAPNLSSASQPLRFSLRPVSFNTETELAATSTAYNVPEAGHVAASRLREPGVDGYEWIHLVGDSVTRMMYLGLCSLCPSAPRDPNDLLRDKDGTLVKDSSTFVCKEWHLIFHFDQAWLDWTPFINKTGALMSAFAPPGTEQANVHKKALLTFVSLGSHSAQYSRLQIEESVPRFVRRMHDLTSGHVVFMLTTAACIDKIPAHHARTHGAWEVLLRNNHRIMLLNEVTLQSATDLNDPVLDLFSLSLSAGCDRFNDAVHAKWPLNDAYVNQIAAHFLPSIIDA